MEHKLNTRLTFEQLFTEGNKKVKFSDGGLMSLQEFKEKADPLLELAGAKIIRYHKGFPDTNEVEVVSYSVYGGNWHLGDFYNEKDAKEFIELYEKLSMVKRKFNIKEEEKMLDKHDLKHLAKRYGSDIIF